MRPVDADKLIELIRNDKIDPNYMKVMEATGCGLQAQTLNMTCDRHITMIKEQPTCGGEGVKRGQWISVSESLPKNDDWVIITILDERGDTPWRYTDFGWYLEAANCWIVEAEQRTDVTAWMPLPEPWKG